MHCPKCLNPKTQVIDSRYSKKQNSVRRRRLCLNCKNRFTTLEEVKIMDLHVLKRNGRTEIFSEEKLAAGISKAFNKREFDKNKINTLVRTVTDEVIKSNKNPIKSTKIGKIVLKNLKTTDDAAYICFWAMYGDFNTAEDFTRLLKDF